MNPDLRIFKDLNELSTAAADLFVESARRAVQERGRFLTALSGGSTPMNLYRLLAREPGRSKINWPRTHIFWGDERCVPPDDPENSYGQARQAFLDSVAIPDENVHRVASDLEPAAAAEEYARRLSRFAEGDLPFPRFDLVLLGMGEDGHTASLFPGSPVEASTPTLAVTAHYQGRPANRVTLTPMVFNAARQIVFLAAGAAKASTLAQVLKGKYNPSLYPAQRIRPINGQVVWMIDQAAAGNLPQER